MREPDNFQALSQLGALLMARQNFDEADGIYRKMISLAPERADSHHMLALSLINAGQYQEAAGPMDRAVELAPHIPLYLVNRGKLHLVAGDWPQAESALLECLHLVPEAGKAEVLNLLGQARSRQGLPILSEEQYRNSAPQTAHAILGDPYPAPGAAAPAPAAAPPPNDRPQAAGGDSLLVCCVTDSDNFVDGFIRGLAPRVRVEKLVSSLSDDFLAGIARHETVWLEWGMDMAAALTNHAKERLRGKRVILRIHHYEVFSGQAEDIDYGPVSDLVFVCRHMRDMLLAKKPEIRDQVERIHVIPNGVDMERFQPAARRPGFNLAYAGWLNYKKGPMVLMHAFEALHREEPRFRLHLAGRINQEFYEPAIQGFLQNNGLGDAVVFYDWVEGMDRWLADQDFIICTSLSESQGMGLMEAMASGVMPLIYNFPGADQIYPRKLLWSNLGELVELTRRQADPADLRAFVEQNYSLDLQVERTRRMLLEKKETVFAGYTTPPGLA
jgi:glycosyltransferase involved in cell wall biosynthesis